MSNYTKSDAELASMLDDRLGIEHKFTTPDVSQLSKIKKKLETTGKSKQAGGFKMNSKTTKQQLLEKIKQIMEANGAKFDANTFKKHSKDDLARTLGDLLNKGFEKIQGIDDESIEASLRDDEEQELDESYEIHNFGQENFDEEPEYTPYQEPAPMEEKRKRGRPPKNAQISVSSAPTPVSAPAPSSISIESAARSLFHLNKLLAKCVESVSEQVGPDLAGVTITKYADNLDEEKDELINLYREIYLEHSEDLDKFVSPVNKVMIINISAVAQGIVKKEAAAVKKN